MSMYVSATMSNPVTATGVPIVACGAKLRESIKKWCPYKEQILKGLPVESSQKRSRKN
jgi:hypothetical protein